MHPRKNIIYVIIILFAALQFNNTCIAKSKDKIDLVAIQIVTPVQAPEEITKFEEWLYARLQVFSNERKDFTVSKDSSVFTHLIKVYIDSIVLVNFKNYQNELSIVDSITSKSTKIALNPFLVSKATSTILGIIISESYDFAAHPIMYMRTEIVDKNGRITNKKKKDIESISTIAVSEVQQLKDLFGILKVFVQKVNPYLHL